MRSAVLLRVDALAAEFVGDVEHVGRGDHDDGRLEVADQLHLLFGLPAGHRDHRAAELFGAVMGAEAAGEQPVAVGDVDDVARPAAGGVDRAGHQVGPHVDVGLGVADDGRLAGRAARGMDAHHLLARHGEHAVRVVVAQVLLGGEGKPREVGQRPEVVRMDAGGVEFRLVMRHVACRTWCSVHARRSVCRATISSRLAVSMACRPLFIVDSLLNRGFSRGRAERRLSQINLPRFCRLTATAGGGGNGSRSRGLRPASAHAGSRISIS